MSKIVRASIAARTLGINVDTVLKLAGKPDDALETSLVDLDALKAKLADKAGGTKKGKKPKNSKKPSAIETVVHRATNPTNRTPGTSARVPTKTRWNAHDPLAGTPTTPLDRKVLAEVQKWANSFMLPPDFVPDLQPAGGQMVSYLLPNGQKVKITTAHGARIKSGKARVVAPKPSHAERTYRAEQLASLSFLSLTCEICGQPMVTKDKFEAGIHGLLEGRFVLPASGYVPNRGLTPPQGWYQFRTADLICRMIEKYIQPWVVNPDLGNAEFAKLMIDAVPHILADCQEKRPETNLNDVLDKLEVVLDFLGGENE